MAYQWDLLDDSPQPAPLPGTAPRIEPPRDLLLDADGDLVIKDGDLVLVGGIEAIRQDVWCRLRFFRGEWFLDASAGVEYFQRILTKPADVDGARDIFRREILATPGVTEVVSLEVAFDGRTRALTGSFVAKTDAGLIEGMIGDVQ